MVKKSSTYYFHFWCETSIISLFHLLVIEYIPCSVCHDPQTPFLTIYNGKQFSQFSIFLDVSESDNSISWCLQGQQTWEQLLHLILIAPLYIEILHSFGKNCFAHSTDLCTLLVLFNADVPSTSDFLLTMFELIVNFL